MTDDLDTNDRSTGAELLGLIPMDDAVGTDSQRMRLEMALLAPFAVPLFAVAFVILLAVEGGAVLLGKLLAATDGE